MDELDLEVSHNDTVVTIASAESGSSHVTWTITGEKSLTTKVLGLSTRLEMLVGLDGENGLRG